MLREAREIAFTHGRTSPFLLSIWKPRSRLVETSCIRRLPPACLTVKSSLRFTVISCRFNAHTWRLGWKVESYTRLGTTEEGIFRPLPNRYIPFTHCNLTCTRVQFRTHGGQSCFPDLRNEHIWHFLATSTHRPHSSYHHG